MGAALGGMVGMIAGDALYKNGEKEKREAFLKGRAPAPPLQAGAMLTLKPARVESRWIEDRNFNGR